MATDKTMRTLGATLLWLAAMTVSGAQAQTAWPVREVRIIIGFSAGGTTDIMTRTLAPELTKLWGQAIVIENRAIFERAGQAVMAKIMENDKAAAALSLVCAAASARELRAATELSAARRIARALPPLAFLALAWFAWNWGLLTNPARY